MWQLRRLAYLAVIAGSLACRRGAAPDPAATGGDLDSPLPSALPKVAARVNGHEITSLRVAHVARLAIKGEGPAAQARAMRATLVQCIDRELLLQEALARGITVEPAVIDQAVDQVRVRHKTEEEWSEALADDGLDSRSFRTEIHERYTVEALMAVVQAGLPPPSEAEIQEYYATHRAAESAKAPGDYEAAHDEAAKRLGEERRDEAVARLVTSLRQRARIEVFF